MKCLHCKDTTHQKEVQHYCCPCVRLYVTYRDGIFKLLRSPEINSDSLCSLCWNFKQSIGAIGTEQEYGCRTDPPDYIGWRNLFLGIDSWAPQKFKNSGSAWRDDTTLFLHGSQPPIDCSKIQQSTIDTFPGPKKAACHYDIKHVLSPFPRIHSCSFQSDSRQQDFVRKVAQYRTVSSLRCPIWLPGVRNFFMINYRRRAQKLDTIRIRKLCSLHTISDICGPDYGERIQIRREHSLFYLQCRGFDACGT